jgi:hypothetical protein
MSAAAMTAALTVPTGYVLENCAPLCAAVAAAIVGRTDSPIRSYLVAAVSRAAMRALNRALFRRYPDGCYAVVRGSRRGPCAHDKPTALARWLRSGSISAARTGR